MTPSKRLHTNPSPNLSKNPNPNPKSPKTSKPYTAMSKDSGLDSAFLNGQRKPKWGRELLPDEESADSRRRRLSEDETLAILKGVIEFRSKTGKAPVRSNMGDFFDSVKDSLRTQINQEQLYNKLRHLRHKFNKTAAHDPGPAHFDRLVHELFAKAWGSEEEKKPNRVLQESEGFKMEVDDGSEEEEDESDEDDNRDEEMGEVGAASYPYLYHELAEYWKMNGLSSEILELGMKLIDPSKAKALEERWAKHLGHDLKLQMKRAGLHKELFDLLSVAHKSTMG